ncbi:hypothetical protein [Xenorhabdus szentirmaii]|uniref:Uncharacterized protein n=1 Tax=Xenorhabdus szentirmaii TaxID=290112 RepID=A0AAW3YVK7_9GAMM|nr:MULTISPECIES: hypothetical protein [Xenorhabdus]MBD2782688.1 hypothetical protein [Xenorhabdus sp. 38]MBD2801522.1 hypothetical protein [Xenorhabdus sp. M]MBD2806549.1 hypothetical protein [Xenorhabdus sp. ZM]MBD2822382.1 hypothetical protein [Xenorhabdus sp. 42]
MTCAGRGKGISRRPWVGLPSAGGRAGKIPVKTEAIWLDSKPVGKPEKTGFRRA